MKLVLSLVIAVLFCQSSVALKITNLSDLKGNELIVTEIDFSNKGLIVFPLEILKCKNLETLNLSNNGLVDLPVELSGLVNLKSLNLSMNQGLSPTDLDLVMQSAKFQLENLTLANCNLMFLSDAISKHKNLTRIDVSGNRLTSLPYSMMEMDKLESINLSDNYLHELAWIVNYWWSLKSIDISGNKDLIVSDVLSSLSYFEQLDEVVLGEINFFPKEFELLNVHRLVIKNSDLEAFPRSDLSRPIDQLVFDNCHFKNEHQIISALNNFGQLNFVEFKNIYSLELIPFLSLEVDSVALNNLGTLNISPLINVESLKWVDLRGTTIVPVSLTKFIAERPEVEILSREKIKENFGISPPIAQYVSDPINKTIFMGSDVKVALGKSVFEIPSNAIVDANGNPVSGPVNLEYTEYLTPQDIFFSGITMTSNEGDETMLFSSGGMFNLTATDQNGNELFVDPANPIGVQLFSGSKNPDMELFKLDKKGIWQYNGKDSITEPFQYNQDKLDSIMNLDFMSKVKSQVRFVSDRYFPVVKRNRKYKTFEISFMEFKSYSNKRNNIEANNEFIQVFNTDYVANFLTKQRFIFQGDSTGHYYTLLNNMNVYCRKQYKRMRLGGRRNASYDVIGPNFLSQLELIPDYENDQYNLKFKYQDNKINLPVSVKSSETETGASLRESRIFYKKYVRAWKQSKKIKNRNGIRLKSLLVKKANYLKRQAEIEEKQRQILMYENRDFMNEAAGTGSIVRAFEINGFGMWNCDVRSRMTAPKIVPTDFVSENGDHVALPREKVVVIDHGMNGVVQFEQQDSAFFDSGSRTTIVVFFSAILVGVYQSWKNRMNETNTELKMLNIDKMNKETFVTYISNDN